MSRKTHINILTLSTDCLRLSQLQWCHSAPVRFKRSAEEINEEIFKKKFLAKFFSLRVLDQKCTLVTRKRIFFSQRFKKYEKQIFRFFRNPDFSTDHPGTKIFQRFWAQPLFLDPQLLGSTDQSRN